MMIMFAAGPQFPSLTASRSSCRLTSSSGAGFLVYERRYSLKVSPLLC